MSTILMFSKKGDKILIKVDEEPGEIWAQLNFIHLDPIKEEYFNRDFLFLTDKGQKIIISRRFIYSII